MSDKLQKKGAIGFKALEVKAVGLALHCISALSSVNNRTTQGPEYIIF